MTLRDRLAANGGVASIAGFFLVVCVYFAVGTDGFLSENNLLNILRQSAPLLIVAAAMTFVITTAGIDLSVGSIVALIGSMTALLMQSGEEAWFEQGLDWPVVFVGMLALGGLLGALQGFFIAYEGIPAFIVTLAGLSVFRGVALLMTGGYSVPVDSESGFVFLGRGWFQGVPMPALIAIAVLAVAALVFNQTRFGRYVTGIGANAEAVRRAGVDIRRVTLACYVLAGIAAALAGLLLTARLGSGSSNAGLGFELEVIAAVVLGSTSLFGGRGTIVGTILGALTVAVIGNGLILSHLSPFLTPIVTGAIILIAIWLNFRLFSGRGRRR
ncbi:MAG: ABC transporter permease [Alphaproteobacteria bacterium]